MVEVLAKAVLLHGSPRQFELLSGNGAAAIAIDRGGRVSASLGIDAYLAEPLHPVVGDPLAVRHSASCRVAAD